MTVAGRSLGQRSIDLSPSVVDAVRSHLGLGERLVAQIATTSPHLAMAQALGGAAVTLSAWQRGLSLAPPPQWSVNWPLSS